MTAIGLGRTKIRFQKVSYSQNPQTVNERLQINILIKN